MGSVRDEPRRSDPCQASGAVCAGSTEDELAANLLAVDPDTWRIKSFPCPSMVTSDYVVVLLRTFLLLHMKEGNVRVLCDSEGGRKAILDRVVADVGDRIIPELTPKDSSASNPAEAAVKHVEEQARVLKLDLEIRCGTRVTAHDVLVDNAVQACGGAADTPRTESG